MFTCDGFLPLYTFISFLEFTAVELLTLEYRGIFFRAQCLCLSLLRPICVGYEQELDCEMLRAEFRVHLRVRGRPEGLDIVLHVVAQLVFSHPLHSPSSLSTVSPRPIGQFDLFLCSIGVCVH